MPYLQREELLRALTPRERDVVERIALGLEIKEIAHELRIGYQTAKMHIQRAKRKLGARNQVEIAILMHGGRPRAAPVSRSPCAHRRHAGCPHACARAPSASG